MKIGIQARTLKPRNGGIGVKEVIWNLLQGFQQNGTINHFIIAYNEKRYIGSFPEAQEIFIPGENRFLWDHVSFPKAMKQLNVDGILWTRGGISPFTSISSAVLIQDLGFFERELHAYPFFISAYMRALIRYAAKKAENIFVPSLYTKNSLVEKLHVAKSKIALVTYGASSVFRQIEHHHIEQFKGEMGFEKPFIFYPTSLSPRKNVPGLLEAFLKIKDQVPHNLVLTGSQQWGDTVDNRLLRMLIKENRVRVLGYVTADEMALIYNSCDFMIFPSFLEGFGLPVIEAMSCGCPVALSNRSSLPEVGGAAAVYFDPQDTNAMSACLYTMAVDKKLRKEYIQKGLARAATFSWAKAADIIFSELKNTEHNE